MAEPDATRNNEFIHHIKSNHSFDIDIIHSVKQLYL